MNGQRMIAFESRYLDGDYYNYTYLQSKMKIRIGKICLKKIRQIGGENKTHLDRKWTLINTPSNFMLPYSWKKQYRKNILSKRWIKL